ncbi:hypothetical protein SEA_PAINTERBOY_94 [Mycobacterium phage PainterBoy]|nr:hypothetical protein SEA_PAINTERBOY_94 [Mycobacterium phage PainterBoy]
MSIAEHREVRVTARESVKMPFAAPDLSPVRTVDIELDKGIPGWTDTDVVVEDLRGGHLSSRAIEYRVSMVEDMTVGVAIPKARVTTAAVRRKRSTKRRWS